MTEAYPLQWPTGRPRVTRRERSRFNTSMATARDALIDELRLLGARYAVLSTNFSLRRDGLPYANQREPEDPGAAIYFEYQGRQMCFACDRWDRVRDNVQAIRLTIAALRGLERWGTGDMVSAAFTGFEALPPPAEERPWWDVLGVPRDADSNAIREAYRQKARECHPDTGGSDIAMAELNAAYQKAKAA